MQASIFNAKDVWVDDLTVIRPEAYQDEYADEYDDYGYSDSEDTGEGSEDTSLDYEVVVKGKMLVREPSNAINQDVLANRIKQLQASFENSNFVTASKPPKISWKYLSDGLKVLPFEINLIIDTEKPLLIRPLTIMEFFKKHPIFFSGVGLCALLTAVGLIFSILGALDLGEASQRYKKADRAFNRLLASNPSPVDTNVKNSDFNVMELSEKLQSMRDELERGTEVEASLDGVRVMAGIQQYISKFKALAKNNTNENGPAPIEIPDDFAFGFDRFKLETTVPEKAEEIILLDKQRDILDYLMSELFATNPQGIVAVARESAKAMTADEEGMFSNDPSIFDISSSVTSKVEGAIDTIAFQITFSGKTNSLREYLNRLAEFDRPIVVRSINVSRPTESVKTKTKEKKNDKLVALFGKELESLQAEQSKEPVVTENVSEFTLTLEYIEIILPEDIAQGESLEDDSI